MIWYPFTVQKGYEPVRIVRGEKEFVYDENGKSYIDAVSSWWTSVHGHRHPAIVAAIEKQLSELDHVMLAGFTHEPAERLARELVSFAGGNFSRVFYSDNGSTAVEVALKIAVQYFYNRGNPEKKRIIHFGGAYHGDTTGAMSVGGDSVFNRPFAGLLFDSPEPAAPDCYHCPAGKERGSCRTECLDDLENLLTAEHGTIAAVIVEPLIMGAGGMIFYKPAVLERLARICRSHDVLVIYDEVFTGFGRTGKNFAFEHAVSPDILAAAKGLGGGVIPIAMTMVSEKVYAEFDSDYPQKAFYHGHTMTGNPVGCSTALASLKLYHDENYPGKIAGIEKFYAKKERLLADKFSFVKNIRWLGAVFALEIDQGEQGYLNPVGPLIRKLSLEKGVLLRPLGNQLYITPPYITSRESLEQVFDAVDYCLERIF